LNWFVGRDSSSRIGHLEIILKRANDIYSTPLAGERLDYEIYSASSNELILQINVFYSTDNQILFFFFYHVSVNFLPVVYKLFELTRNSIKKVTPHVISPVKSKLVHH
jgi:hypothetical protein